MLDLQEIPTQCDQCEGEKFEEVVGPLFKPLYVALNCASQMISIRKGFADR